ncbi:MAG TPA: caspase family protein [Terracidiphilus sp.]
MLRSALIIANWEYQDPLLRGLVSPSRDAESLAGVLGDPAIGNFEVSVLANQPSYRISEETEAFFGDRERDDLLLLYFSGHGVTDDDGQLYYAAPNTLHKRLRSTAVAASWVNDIMNQCRSRRQVLVLDCCHSGAVARTKAAGVVNVGKYFTGSTPEEGRGKFILTASDAFQYSFEGDAVMGVGVESVFTEALVEGLRSGAADSDGDGQVTLDELYSFVYERVRERTAQQTPRKWASEVEGTFVIDANPATPEVPLPDDLQLAIESEFSAVKEKAIPRLERLLRGRHRGLALSARKALVVLGNDDSKRISLIAEQCLLAYTQEMEAVSGGGVVVMERSAGPGSPPGIAQAEAERKIREKVEADRLARERGESERKAKAQAEADRNARETAEAERLAQERAEAERKARAKAERERKAREKAESDRLALERMEAERRVEASRLVEVGLESAAPYEGPEMFSSLFSDGGNAGEPEDEWSPSRTWGLAVGIVVLLVIILILISRFQ